MISENNQMQKKAHQENKENSEPKISLSKSKDNAGSGDFFS